MLALEPFRIGTEYNITLSWLFENIEPWDEPDYCSCGALDETSDIHYEWWMDATSAAERWAILLACKRNDVQYPTIVDSIREFGFLVPMTLRLYADGKIDTWGDGHHRLAAAVELGMTHVPALGVHQYDRVSAVRNDSGSDTADEWDIMVDGKYLATALALRGY